MATARDRTRLPTITPYGNGFSFRYRDESGRQRRITRPTEQEAIEERARIHGDLSLGIPTSPLGLTFADAAKLWRRTKRKPRYSTMVNWDGIVRNHLLPAFGDYLCQDIADNPEAFIGSYIDGKLGAYGAAAPPVRDGSQAKRLLSVQSVHHHLTILGQVFELVERQTRGRIRNPVGDVEVPPVPDFDPIPLEPAEVTELVSYIDVLFKAHVWAMTNLGLRISELLAVKDVDWEPDAFPQTGEGILHVRRQLARGDKSRGETPIVEVPPKTERGKHDYRISAQLNQILRERQALTAGWQNPKGLLFGNSAGGYESASNFRSRVFLPAVVAMTCKKLTARQLARVKTNLDPGFPGLSVDLLALPYTTCRLILRLTWGDLRGGHLSLLDTDGIQREVEIPTQLEQTLVAHRAAQKESGRPNKRDLILLGPGQRSASYRLERLALAVKKALDTVELMPTTTPHRLRTTYISALIADGTDPETTSRRARHARTETTFRRYVRQFERQRMMTADTAHLYFPGD